MADKETLSVKEMGLKQYVHWIFCIREVCGEAKNGKCVRGRGMEPEDFPSRGKCLYPTFMLPGDIDKEYYGAFETVEQEEEMENIPF